MIGTIKTMPPKKGFCFVVAPNGKEYFLHRSEFHGFWDDLELDFNNTDDSIEIQFDEAESPRGPRAANAKRNAWPNEGT